MAAAPHSSTQAGVGTQNALDAQPPPQAQTELEGQPGESTAATNSNMHMHKVCSETNSAMHSRASDKFKHASCSDMNSVMHSPCACGTPQEHLAGARIPTVLGKTSTHTAQQGRRHHPRQQEVDAGGPRQATEAKPPPRAYRVDPSGNSVPSTAAPTSNVCHEGT